MSNAIPTALPELPPRFDIPLTHCDLDYADLLILDFAQCATSEGRQQLASQVQDALCKTGFFYVINHGLSNEETKRMFDIADVPFCQVNQDEKSRYTGSVKEGGLYQGYKARQTWYVEGGVRDQIETYNINRDVHKREHPIALRPFLPEIAAFAQHTHMKVLHQILRLLALGLELPEETFVRLHNFAEEGGSAVRFITYYPRSEEDEIKSNNVWLKGHQDTGTVTILYSQPISGLQVLSSNGTWKWVKHIENALVINTGDSMKFLSGGYYKSTIHRVVQPPPDQRLHRRLGVFYFCMPDDDVVLAPRLESPVIQRIGVSEELRGNVHPTMGEWQMAKSMTYGQTRLKRQENGMEEELVLGKVVRHYS